MKLWSITARLRAAVAASADFARRGRLERARFSRLLQTALPSQCAMCGKLSQHVICAGCDGAYWQDAAERCRCCALPLPPGVSVSPGPGSRPGATMPRLCGACLARLPAFDATLALADYRAPLAHLAVELKFHARLSIAHELARRLVLARSRHAARLGPGIDLFLPVPLSAKRLAARGYNQAWEIARPLARCLNVRADAAAAVRRLDTPPQAQLDAAARRRNVRAAFAVAAPVKGLHVAVVDDVMTSGATLDALARALKRAGAARVTNFVAFRTPKS